MVLSILLYLALAIWLAFLGGYLSRGFSWQDKIKGIAFSIFIWPGHLFQLVYFELIWKRIAALVAYFAFIVYFRKSYGIAYYWLILITAIWYIALIYIQCNFCRRDNSQLTE